MLIDLEPARTVSDLVRTWERTRGWGQRLVHRVPTPLRQKRTWKVFALLVLAVGLVILAAAEMRTSHLQSFLFSAIAAKISFSVQPGFNDELRHPRSGPFDIRLGYSKIGDFVQRLEANGYEVLAQTRASETFNRLMDLGLYPIYDRKPQAGITILDRDGRELFATRWPERIYPSFEAIPPVVVNSLLYIENREILDQRYPFKNPAIEWDRLAYAGLTLGLNKLGLASEIAGGSTLATQLEKIHHSPDGVTGSVAEKGRQMLSASLRAYRDGRDTAQARRRIVRDYLNSIPLTAAPRYGEVHGLGDGLAIWFGADFEEVNRLLWKASNGGFENPEELARAARAYRQVLSLLLAVKKPSEYLLADRAALERRVEMYLDILAREGVVPARLAAEARRTRVEFRDRFDFANPIPFSQRKGTNLVRVELMEQLGLRSLYDLDRLDLKVATSLDGDIQREVAAFLARLKDPEFATAAGLRGPRLLGAEEDPSRVIYSVTLYERTPEANVLRVHADNYDQPLDINAQTKLELGSTAKLRTLVHYLQVVAELHERFSAMSREELASLELAREDRLSQWAREYLLAAEDKSLEAMLEAAMNRRYSASPGETFFTGGGAHRFSNFDAADNGRILTVREAFHRSVNLVFIRLMRDLVYYHLMRLPEVTPAVLDDPAHPARKEILAQFADWEGSIFLTGFYRKYEGLKGDEALEKLVAGLRSKTPRRLAVIYRSVRPDVGVNGFAAFLIGNLLEPNLKDSLIESLYEAYSPEKFSLADRAYLAGVHPLELWLLEYKMHHPDAPLKEVLAASRQVRQDSYAWLFRARAKRAQDRAIRIMLEREAFKEVHKVWKRTGFPFPRLVPSYATSIGSSGDTPAALAELIGIIVNDGVRRPTIRIRQLQFAENTPFETILAPKLEAREQVLPPAVARQVRQELIGVVETGTARRAWRSIVLSGGEVVPVGGKTGTGDNRYEAYARSGSLISSRVVNRTATFVFVIGDRFFGTVTAFVPGEAAASYRFTSSLPVQVFKDLGPLLVNLIEKKQIEAASLWPRQPALVARLGTAPVLR